MLKYIKWISRGNFGTYIHICEYRPLKGQKFLSMKLKSNDQEGYLKLEHVSYLCEKSMNMQWMLQFLWPKLLLLLFEHWNHVKSLFPLCSSHTTNLHEASLFFPEISTIFPKVYILWCQNILLLQMKPSYLCQQPFCIRRVKF